jgi:chromate reductase
MKTIRLAGISGSLRQASSNTAILRTLQASLPAGVEMTLLPLDGIPLYNQDLDGPGLPDAVRAFKAAVDSSDGVVMCSPEYNFGMPGVLKNAIDWASRPPDQPFAGKPVALMGASAGMFGSGRAQYHLRQSFVFLDAIPMNKPEVMIPLAQNKFDDKGNLTDEPTRKFISDALVALVAWTNRVGAKK